MVKHVLRSYSINVFPLKIFMLFHKGLPTLIVQKKNVLSSSNGSEAIMKNNKTEKSIFDQRHFLTMVTFHGPWCISTFTISLFCSHCVVHCKIVEFDMLKVENEHGHPHKANVYHFNKWSY